MRLSDEEIERLALIEGVGSVRSSDTYYDDDDIEHVVTPEEFIRMLKARNDRIYDLVFELYESSTFNEILDVIEAETSNARKLLLLGRDGHTKGEKP